jgi:hypothetical protein
LSAFLTSYPELAAWFADLRGRESELSPAALSASFLDACKTLGVPEDACSSLNTQQMQAELVAYFASSANTSDGPDAPIDALIADDAPTGISPEAAPAVDTASVAEEEQEIRQSETDEEEREITEGKAETAPEESEQSEAGEAVAEAESTTETLSQVSERLESDEGAEETASQPEASEEKAETSEQQVSAGEEVEAVAEIEGVAAGVKQENASPPARMRLWRRARQPRRPRRRWSLKRHLITWTLLTLLLSGILIPAGFLVNFGMSAYSAYNNISKEAKVAVSHLTNVQNIFTTPGRGQSVFSSALNEDKLEQAQKEFIASGQDFQQLHDQLQRSSTLQAVVTYFPSYRSMLQSAQVASLIGVDIARIGQIITASGMQIAPSLKGPLLASASQPLVTPQMLNAVSATITQVIPLLNDVQAKSTGLDLNTLPISAKDRSEIEPVLQRLPEVIKDLGIAQSMLGVAGWLLGVDAPRTFLVQTMDETELRGAGGFTGQYGELKINGGRVGPFNLQDISLLEYTPTSANQGQTAPTQYSSWWPFANFGLRDSNISADFPTTAQLAINLYKQEEGDQVDGVISFTPVLIEHILNVIGSVYMPDYKVTVTAQNLEDLLHYYQLNNTGITQQEQQTSDTATSVRKRFTNTLASLFLQRVRAASPSQLLAMGQIVLSDLKSRDLEVYFANPTAEAVLEQYGLAGQMDRSTAHDGLYIVQQNLSASKASQYVQTTIHDTVTLDSKGGATHVLQLRLVYNQAGTVYGYDTYYDYLRVYVPPNSRLISGDGFSNGTPLCGGAYGDCPTSGVYPGGELTCPAGQYQPGSSPPSLTGSDGVSWQPLQQIGGPTNTTSDEPGRAMYGGWVIVPKNCTMNVTLSWYVPSLSQQPYSLLIQRQTGTFPQLDLSILPSAADCALLRSSGLHFAGVLTKDASFTLPVSQSQTTSSGGADCYPGSGV